MVEHLGFFEDTEAISMVDGDACRATSEIIGHVLSHSLCPFSGLKRIVERLLAKHSQLPQQLLDEDMKNGRAFQLRLKSVILLRETNRSEPAEDLYAQPRCHDSPKGMKLLFPIFACIPKGFSDTFLYWLMI